MAERSRIRAALGVLAAVLGVVGALLVVVPPGAQARPVLPSPVGSDKFSAGQAYAGDFPDPTVLRVGRTYFAYATTIAYLNLPVLTSTDLVHWTARASNDPQGRWFLNDAMPAAAPWAVREDKSYGRVVSATWAPSVLRKAPWVWAAYTVPNAYDPLQRRCVSIAAATNPNGPFTDNSAAPLVCSGSGGDAIDPQLFRDRGRDYLLWKDTGDGGIHVRRLNTSLTAFAPAAPARTLLLPKLAWERGLVENPAMVRYRKRLYLFYSASDFTTASYATGYAVCPRVLGPCKRLRKAPFLASGWGLDGPGGATPFFDTAGRLRLAYHAWGAGQVGYPSKNTCLQETEGCAQRRMYVATLTAGRRGWLRVTTLY